MPKVVTVNFPSADMLEVIPFKKLALFFDAIYIELIPWTIVRAELNCSKKMGTEQKNFWLQELDWLQENEVIKTYHLSKNEIASAYDDQLLLHDIVSSQDLEFGQSHTNAKADIRNRINAQALSNKFAAIDFVPAVYSFDSYNRLQASQFAAQFIVKQLPMPALNTPWAELMQFRSDEDIKRKYYALIHWMNDISLKNVPIHHIVDEFNYFYSQYCKQYSLHKLTTSFTTVELLVITGLECLNSLVQGSALNAFNQFLTIHKQRVKLLKGEKDIEGRQLAYILSANEKFGRAS